MRLLLGLNATLAFLLELALLGSAAAVGLLLPGPPAVRVAVAVLLPLLVLAAWATVLAPRSTRRLGPQQRLLVQTALFAVAVAALAVLGQVVWAVVLAALVALRIGLGARLGRI